MGRCLSIIVCVVLLISCDKEKENTTADDNLEISMGTICGFIGGSSLLINREHIVYQSFIYTKEEKKVITTSDSCWNGLINLLDYNKFRSINLNECNSCADGCDTWVSIKTDTAFHKITFGTDDSTKLKEIQPFLEKLEYLRAQFY